MRMSHCHAFCGASCVSAVEGYYDATCLLWYSIVYYVESVQLISWYSRMTIAIHNIV